MKRLSDKNLHKMDNIKTLVKLTKRLLNKRVNSEEERKTALFILNNFEVSNWYKTLNTNYSSLCAVGEIRIGTNLDTLEIYLGNDTYAMYYL